MQHHFVFHLSDQVEIHFPVCQSFKSILIARLRTWVWGIYIVCFYGTATIHTGNMNPVYTVEKQISAGAR